MLTPTRALLALIVCSGCAPVSKLRAKNITTPVLVGPVARVGGGAHSTVGPTTPLDAWVVGFHTESEHKETSRDFVTGTVTTTKTHESRTEDPGANKLDVEILKAMGACTACYAWVKSLAIYSFTAGVAWAGHQENGAGVKGLVSTGRVPATPPDAAPPPLAAPPPPPAAPPAAEGAP